MSDTPPTPPAPPTGGSFCAECGAAMPADARFCGACGAPPPGAAPVRPGGGADPTVVSGAPSTWQGVEPVVERPTEVTPPVPPGAGGPPPAGPPPGAPPVAGGPPPVAPTDSKGKGPLVLVLVVVLALLAGGAFFLLGGDDDGGDDERAQDEETTTTEDQDEETTTTTEADDQETTTTTEADDVETTTTAVVDDGGLNFAQALDDSGRLVVEVPDFWQFNGAPLADGTPNILAASDIEAFAGGFQASGVSYTLLTGTPDPNAVIDFLTTSNNVVGACTAEPREDYTDGVFTGRRQVFTNCEGRGLTIVDVVAARADGTTVDVTMALVPEDSFDIITQIENTFNLTS